MTPNVNRREGGGDHPALCVSAAQRRAAAITVKRQYCFPRMRESERRYSFRMHVRGGSRYISSPPSLCVRGKITPPRTPAVLHRIFYRQGAHLAPVLPRYRPLFVHRGRSGDRPILSVATQRPGKFGPFSPGNTTFTLNRRGNFISYLSYVRYRLRRVCPWEHIRGFYRAGYLYSFEHVPRALSRDEKSRAERYLEIKSTFIVQIFQTAIRRTVHRAVI